MRLRGGCFGARDVSQALKPVDVPVASAGRAADGDGGARPAPDQRARHLMEVAMLAAALPLLVMPEGRSALANKKIAMELEAAPEPPQGAAPHGPLSDDAELLVLLAEIMATLGLGRPRAAADEMPVESGDAFLALFAADMAAPSTLDHLWMGQGAPQPGGIGIGIGGSAHGAAGGGRLVPQVDDVVYSAPDDASLFAEEMVAALEESFWELVAEIAVDFPEILAVLEPLMSGIGEVPPAAPGLVVDIGGAATAAGDVAVAVGDVAGALYGVDHLMIATGAAQFTAQAVALDAAFAGSDAMTWLDVAGADVVLTLGFEFDGYDNGTTYAISAIEFFALDYAGWAPPNGTIYIDVAERDAAAAGVGGSIGPLQLAAVTAQAVAFSANSDVETSSQAVTFENTFSTVNAHAVFAGAV